MIDIHCHILPGFDDGPETMEEALEMCRTAVADGILSIVATPHYNPGRYGWTEAALLDAVTSLQQALDTAGIDLVILPGAELPLFPELPSMLAIGSHLTINRSSFFLMEFPPRTVPANAEQLLAGMIESGLTPIIAHPERNSWFAGNPGVLTSLVQRGTVLQITAGSLLGEFGTAVRNFAVKLLTDDLVHCIATDAHNSHDRPALLSDAVALAADLIGREKATRMVTSLPEAIISGKAIPLHLPAGYPASDQPRTGSWLRRLFGSGA